MADDLDQPPNTLSVPPPYSTPSTPQRSLTPAPDPSDTRPLLLCLHGGGSTSVVFKIQTRRLIWNLSSQFRFIFCNAPHQGAPGFGMLPVFESCAPFYRWVTRKWKLGEGDVEGTGAEEVALVDAALDACVARETGLGLEEVQTGKGWERVVGVMGFSQGARLVPGLLLRQRILQREGKHSRWNFKFGVVVGGPYPPISMMEDVDVDVKDYELLKQIPTVHAWGRDDHIKSGCVELHKTCEGDECFQMDFEGGHHMPLKDGEARDLCDLILAAWYAGGGAYAIGAGEKY